MRLRASCYGPERPKRQAQTRWTGLGVQGHPPDDDAILVELDALEPRESIIDWGRRQQHAPKLKAPEAVTAVKVEGILSQGRSVPGTLS